MTYIEFLQNLKSVLKKHDNKVFGKRFEKDLQDIIPDAYISSSIGLQYVYCGEFRAHIGWDKRPIEAERVCLELDRIIENQKESDEKRQTDLKNIKFIRAKFEQLKELIEACDKLHYETKNELKKEFDIDFKTYFTG